MQGDFLALPFTEAIVEEAALDWFERQCWVIVHGSEISPDGSEPERSSYDQVVLQDHLRIEQAALNPEIPSEVLDDAFRRLTQPEGPTFESRNRAFHRMLIDGVTVEHKRPDVTIAGRKVKVVDFDAPDNNDWLVVNQFTVTEDQHTRRPDVLLFLNGLPLVVIEMKNLVNRRMMHRWRGEGTFEPLRALI